MADYTITVVKAVAGDVEATVTYPQDGRNYWLALSGGQYEVYKVVQEFTGWDASQPLVFTDGQFPLGPGTYTLALRERYKCHGHDMCWRTLASQTVVIS